MKLAAAFAALVVCMPIGFLRPAAAQVHVDLELVLLADATGSIDDAEIRFQREGYAQAITDPAVISAIRGAGGGRIAVTYVEWGHATSQDVVVDWTLIDSEATAAAFAEALLAPPRRAHGGNAIGAALLFGKQLIEGNDFEGFRRVIDQRHQHSAGPALRHAQRDGEYALLFFRGIWHVAGGNHCAA